MNENRFESIDLLPKISTKNKINSCNLAFDKQVSREAYHEVYVKKQEDHKVDANVYNVSYALTRER